MAPTLSVDHGGLSLTPANLEATIRWYTSKLDFVVERRFETHGISFPFIANQEIRVELVGAASHACSAPVSDIALREQAPRMPFLAHRSCSHADRGASTVSHHVDEVESGLLMSILDARAPTASRARPGPNSHERAAV